MPERASSQPACPDLAELLLASEGELPKRRLEAIREHVRRCAACRARLGDAAGAIAAYGDQLVDTPPTPDDIDALEARDARFHERLREDVRATQQALAHRHGGLRWPRLDTFVWPRGKASAWLPVAAAVPVIVLALLFSSRYTSTLKADELLTRAAVQQQAEPKATVHRVRISFTPSTRAAATTITREVGDAAFVAARAPAPVEHTLAALFATHRFDLDDPLNVSRFQSWRASLSRKQDIVRPIEDDARLVALKTMTDEGALESAEIVIRRTDYHPVRQTLAFENVGEVQVEEVASWVASVPRMADAIQPVAPPARAIDPPLPDAGELDQAELEARRVLHDTGVDLDGDATIQRTPRAIDIRARVAPSRLGNLRQQLSAIPHVRTTLRTTPAVEASKSTTRSATRSPGDAELLASAGLRPAPSAAQPDAPGGTTAGNMGGDDASRIGGASPTASTTGAGVPIGLTRWRERTFARNGDDVAFIESLVDEVDRLRARAQAYQALAVRYGDANEEQLEPAARQKLLALVASYHRDLLHDIDIVDRRLALLIGSSTRKILPEEVDARWWRRQATQAGPSAQHVHETVMRLLQEDDIPLATERRRDNEPAAARDVRRAMDRLWAIFEPQSPQPD